MSHTSDGDGKGVPFSPALYQALRTADAKHRASLDVLQDAICEYVEDLRERGVPTHDIAPAIRRRISDLQSSGGITTLSFRVDGIVDVMVESCLGSGE